MKQAKHPKVPTCTGCRDHPEQCKACKEETKDDREKMCGFQIQSANRAALPNDRFIVIKNVIPSRSGHAYPSANLISVV